MNDNTKTRHELIQELADVRQRLKELESIEAAHHQALADLQERKNELEIFNRTSRALVSTSEPERVVTVLLTEINNWLGAEASCIWQIDPDTEKLECTYLTGAQPDSASDWFSSLEQEIAGRVVSTGKSLILPDSQTDTGSSRKAGGKTNTRSRSLVSVPLRLADELLGVLQVVDSKPDRFGTKDVKTVESLAAAASTLIDNARLRQETEQQRAFSEDIVHSVQEGVILEDLTGHTVFANPYIAEMLGYDVQELIGKHWSALAFPGDRSLVEAETAKRAHGIASRYETSLMTKQGRRIPVIVSARPLFQEIPNRHIGALSWEQSCARQVTNVIVVFTDISNLKEAEEALRHRLSTEELITAISTRFMGLPHTKIDDQIQQAVKSIGQHLAVERSGLAQFELPAVGQEKTETKLRSVHQWQDESTTMPTYIVQDEFFPHLKWSLKKLEQGEPVIVPTLDDLPAEARADREYLSANCIRSIILFPLLRGASLIGCLGAASVRSEKTWTEEDMCLLRLSRDIMLNVLARKYAQQALQESEDKFHHFVQQSRDGIIITDDQGKVVDWNPAAERIMGLERDHVLGQRIWKIQQRISCGEARSPWSQEMFETSGIRLLTTYQDSGIEHWMESEISHPDGTHRHIYVVSFPMWVDQGLFVGNVVQDITERKHTEAEREHLLTTEREQRVLTEALRQASAALSATLNYEEVLDLILEQIDLVLPNEAADVMLIQDGRVHTIRWRGYKKYQSETYISGLTYEIASVPNLLKMQTTGRPLSIPNVAQYKEWVYEPDAAWINSYIGAPIKVRDQVIGFLNVNSSKAGFFKQTDADRLQAFADQAAIAIENARLYDQAQRELEERRRAEAVIQTSLREKEVLLKEIHHRVKNNLQLISSLLDLQSETIQDIETLRLFQDSQRRVRSIAIIHEKLYQSTDLAEVIAEEYVQDIVHHLFGAFGGWENGIHLTLSVDRVALNLDTAIPIGLIINELVSNALKYAFPEDFEPGNHAPERGDEKEIGIDLQQEKDGTLRLVVWDNGVGLPPQTDFERSVSLGLQLVSLLTRQIRATIGLDTSSGTLIKITCEGQTSRGTEDKLEDVDVT